MLNKCIIIINGFEIYISKHKCRWLLLRDSQMALIKSVNIFPPEFLKTEKMLTLIWWESMKLGYRVFYGWRSTHFELNAWHYDVYFGVGAFWSFRFWRLIWLAVILKVCVLRSFHSLEASGKKELYFQWKYKTNVSENNHLHRVEPIQFV